MSVVQIPLPPANGGFPSGWGRTRLFFFAKACFAVYAERDRRNISSAVWNCERRDMYSKRTTLLFLGILTLIVLGFAFVITQPFLYPISAAIILAVVFYPAYQRILGWTKGKPGKASMLSILALLFLFGVPVFIIVMLVAKEAVTAAQYLTHRSAEQGGFT
jgi:hypothetical protein